MHDIAKRSAIQGLWQKRSVRAVVFDYGNVLCLEQTLEDRDGNRVGSVDSVEVRMDRHEIEKLRRKAMTRNQIRITLLSGFALVAALIASRPVAAQDAKQRIPTWPQSNNI
jgi:hypothetical protein